jgi:hypothetical protein
MIKDKRNIDALFEEGLKHLKEKPPAYTWDKLDKGLDRVKFKKSMVYIRWIAASVLIILAFGAGYYYAIYNLNTPEIADDSNLSTSASQNTKLADPQSIQDTKDNFSEISVTEQPETNNSQTEKTNLPSLNNEILATNYNSSNINNEFIDSENLIDVISKQDKSTDEIRHMQKIGMDNIPVNQQSISTVLANKQIPVANTEIAVTEPSTMSPYYYPEDYGLKPNKKELETKWALGAQFAPVISYRDISISYENQQGNIINDDESQFNNAEDALLSYAGGIDFNYHVSKRWSIQSGLYFSRIGQVNNDALNFKQGNNQYLLYSINTSTGNISITFEKVPDDVRKIDSPKDTLESVDIGNVKIIQNFDLFEIPVMVKYKVLNKRFGINLSGGLSPAYVIKNNTYLEVENSKHDIGSSDNLNPMIVNTVFALGFNYGITQKLSINFEPTFKYSLSPINKNSQFDYHPYYFSWYTGIRYNF